MEYATLPSSPGISRVSGRWLHLILRGGRLAWMTESILLGEHPFICLTLGTITGCFGGIIRDILLNRIPLIFRKEIYATACIAGGAVYLILEAFSTYSDSGKEAEPK